MNNLEVIKESKKIISDLINLMLDKTALKLYKNKKVDDLCSALTVVTFQFNSKVTKNAIKFLKDTSIYSQ